MTLDTSFESKDDIASAMENRLSESMARYGFQIVNTLVTDISPDQKVRDLMNSINAAQRKAIATGIADQYEMLKRACIEDTAQQLLLMSQYFDSLGGRRPLRPVECAVPAVDSGISGRPLPGDSQLAAGGPRGGLAAGAADPTFGLGSET